MQFPHKPLQEIFLSLSKYPMKIFIYFDLDIILMSIKTSNCGRNDILKLTPQFVLNFNIPSSTESSDVSYAGEHKSFYHFIFFHTLAYCNNPMCNDNHMVGRQNEHASRPTAKTKQSYSFPFRSAMFTTIFYVLVNS